MNRIALKKYHFVLFPLLFILIHIPFGFAKSHTEAKVEKIASVKNTGINNVSNTVLYDSMKLYNLGLSEEAFDYAMKGFNYLRSIGKLNNDNILSIVDFSLPSSKKRLFVIDVENFKVLFNTYVAHGRNSGKEYANQFSNLPESFKSSLGFYITKGTYNGEHGFSLQLEGEEKGINDNALSRSIVVHCADYVNERLAKTQGYIGRSLGCPALPKQYSTPIIQTIKNGSCFFMFSPDSNYLTHSQLLQEAS